MKSITRYRTSDGEEFDSADEAKAHEAGSVVRSVVGLTEEQVRAALSREDVVLADAIEAIGRQIVARRMEMGGSKRTRRAKPEAAEAVAGAVTHEPVELTAPQPAEPVERAGPGAKRKAA